MCFVTSAVLLLLTFDTSLSQNNVRCCAPSHTLRMYYLKGGQKHHMLEFYYNATNGHQLSTMYSFTTYTDRTTGTIYSRKKDGTCTTHSDFRERNKKLCIEDSQEFQGITTINGDKYYHWSGTHQMKHAWTADCIPSYLNYNDKQYEWVLEPTDDLSTMKDFNCSSPAEEGQ